MHDHIICQIELVVVTILLCTYGMQTLDTNDCANLQAALQRINSAGLTLTRANELHSITDLFMDQHGFPFRFV